MSPLRRAPRKAWPTEHSKVTKGELSSVIRSFFTVIDPKPRATKNNNPGKKYYRSGFRTVRWKARDANDDALTYTLEVENKAGFVLTVREDLRDDQLSVDTTALPDGQYRFRLTASDAETNPGSSEEALRFSRWFVVDNTPPEVALAREGDRWLVTVTDSRSAVSRVEWSRDGERWHQLAPSDGILDGKRETFSFPAEQDRGLVVVRAIDRHHNRATAGMTEGGR